MSSAWLWFRGTGSQGDPTHCPVTAGTPSSTKTGSLLAQWLLVLVPHISLPQPKVRGGMKDKVGPSLGAPRLVRVGGN